MFDNLNNSINDFVKNIIVHLIELNEKEEKYCWDESLFLNIIVPRKRGMSLVSGNKGLSLSVRDNYDPYHNDKKFYSTSTNASVINNNSTNIKYRHISKLYTTNSLTLSSNNFGLGRYRLYSFLN